MSFLSGKKILITGIANINSIAYGIAKVMYNEGADLAFTYYNNRIKERIINIAKNFNSKIVLQCDVSKDTSIINMADSLSNFWSKFDGFVHAIAYAPNKQLDGDYINSINRESFTISHEISSYSFVAIAKACINMFNKESSLVTLTYIGAEKVIKNYNIMGIAKASLEANTRYMANDMGKHGVRVNAISAGPIKTLSSYRIKNFKKIISFYKNKTPIGRLINIEDIGKTAAFLCSDLSSGITGEVIHVDGGFNICSHVYDYNL